MLWDILNEIDFSMVFAQEYSSFRKLGRTESQKLFLEDIYRNCTKLVIEEELASAEKKLILFKSMNRVDYNNFLHEVSSIRNDIVVDLNKRSSDLNVELVEYIKENFRYSLIIEDVNPYLQLALRIKMLSYCYLFNKIRRFTRKAIFFSDMQGPENFFCQAFKLSGVITATLQHGLYVEYSDNNNINIINYKNHVADYFLAWGTCTANLIHKYRPDSKVVIVGKPTLQRVSDDYSRWDFGCILIVSDQKIFNEYNLEMIEVVIKSMPEELDRMFLKLHPSNDKNIYLERFPQLKITDVIPDEVGLVVGHTTSLLYEMFSQGFNVVRYSTVVDSIYFPAKVEFRSINEFNKARIFACSNRLKSDSEYYINYLGNESLERYSDFIKYFDRV